MSQDSFLVSSTHVRAFVREREYSKRVRYNITVGVMEDNTLLRVHDVVAAVKKSNDIVPAQRGHAHTVCFVAEIDSVWKMPRGHVSLCRSGVLESR